MANKGKNRRAQLKIKSERKAKDQLHPSGTSKYARKKDYLFDKNPRGEFVRRQFGFEVPEPKPWK